MIKIDNWPSRFGFALVCFGILRFVMLQMSGPFLDIGGRQIDSNRMFLHDALKPCLSGAESVTIDATKPPISCDVVQDVRELGNSIQSRFDQVAAMLEEAERPRRGDRSDSARSSERVPVLNNQIDDLSKDPALRRLMGIDPPIKRDQGINGLLGDIVILHNAIAIITVIFGLGLIISMQFDGTGRSRVLSR